MAGTVLIVEDDPALRDMMAVMLSSEGFEPSTATNGRDAIAQLDSGYRPDVILLDLMMPVMNGHDFLDRCRRDPFCARIPVIVLSAAADRMPDIAAAAVFQKPLDFEAVLAAVRHPEEEA
jgi:CheY-like chemotaxis protein